MMAVSLSQSTTADGDCECPHDNDGDDNFGSSNPVRSRSGTRKCPICGKVASNDSSLWQHINVEYITRQSFPDASFLAAHKQNVCSMCGFIYSQHWKYCHCTQGAGKSRCRGLMVKPSESKWFPNMTASSREFPEPDKTNSASCYSSSFDSSYNNIANVQNEVTKRFLEFSEISETELSSCQNHTSSYAKLKSALSDDLVLTGIHAAASLVCLDGDEHRIFQAVMNEAVTLPVYSIAHVPRSVTPLLAQVLAIELEHGYLNGLGAL